MHVSHQCCWGLLTSCLPHVVVLMLQVYFEQPRHALVYSSWGRLSYTDKPTPEGRTW
jgi:hypothetical protein